MTSLLRLLLMTSLAAAAVSAQDLPTKRVLFFTKSSGFEHSAIALPTPHFKPRGGNEVQGIAFTVLKQLGQRDHIDFVFSKDGSLFTPEYLAQFDAFLFYTTGDLTKAGTDGNPPMTPAGKAALLAAVAGGKGFVGTHSASDTFHSGGLEAHAPGRFVEDGDQADPYIKMLGGEFIQHGQQQVSHLIVADPSFPGASALPADNHLFEEWYSMKNFAPDLHVILVQDTSGMKGMEYARPNYPSTWAHPYGKGRVFYTNLGHRDDVWTNPAFQALVQGGLDWSLGRVSADVTPNLSQAAPGAGTLPTYAAPAKH